MKTELSEMESIRLRELAYSVMSPQAARSLSDFITIAMGPRSNLDEYSAGLLMLLYLEECKKENGPAFVYDLITNSRISQNTEV